MTALLRNSRQQLLFFLFFLGVVTAFFLILFFLHTKQQNVTANILPTTQNIALRSVQIHTQHLGEHIAQKNFLALQNQLSDFSNLKNFMTDVSTCKQLTNITIEPSPSGFWLSFLCNKTGGESLHPFFGFFTTTDDPQILWGENPKGQILEQTDTGAQKKVRIKNTSDTIWSTTNIWVNGYGQEILVQDESGDNQVSPGESAIFITDTEDTSLFFQNSTHGFYIQL